MDKPRIHALIVPGLLSRPMHIFTRPGCCLGLCGLRVAQLVLPKELHLYRPTQTCSNVQPHIMP